MWLERDPSGCQITIVLPQIGPRADAKPAQGLSATQPFQTCARCVDAELRIFLRLEVHFARGGSFADPESQDAVWHWSGKGLDLAIREMTHTRPWASAPRFGSHLTLLLTVQVE
eukprot:scaffold2349_cov31-Tisochrysis_lutea.AAC.3